MSTLTAATPAPTDHAPRRGAATTLAVLTALAVVVGLLTPDRTQGSGMDGMSMTHYMGLLAVQQPWNLLLFMAIPVILAETLAITELVILFARPAPSWVHGLSRWAGLLAGPVEGFWVGAPVLPAPGGAAAAKDLRLSCVILPMDAMAGGLSSRNCAACFIAGVAPLSGRTICLSSAGPMRPSPSRTFPHASTRRTSTG